MQQDLLHRYIFDNLDVRGELVQLEQTYSDIIANHNYPAPVKAMMGDLLVATCLLTATIKFEGDIAVQIQGDGPVKYAVINGDNQQNMRGVARIQGEITGSSLSDLFGRGHMVITITPNKGEPYQGIVALQGDTLGECLELYFEQSEQLRTKLWITTENGVDSSRCAGMLLQILPVDKAKAEADFQHLEALTATITDKELLELDAETVLTRLYHQDSVRVFEPQAVNFVCGCSRQKTENALVNVGQDVLLEDIEKHGEIKISCNYCLKDYIFNKQEILDLFK